MTVNLHEKYISRCIELGKNALSSTYPNPRVGCVIVYKDTVIGEGYTNPYGGNHAEVNAIESVKDKSLLKHASLYVTLEPCSHFGKTPPCADLIVKHKIPHIIIGTIDSNEKVSGRGIKKLIDAGCSVKIGVLENECNEHHKRFFAFHNKKRPYIILKWAQSKDGYISPVKKKETKPIWITNKYSRQLVHKWRSEEASILVGTKTVVEDNPSLTTRNWEGNSPVRVVIDRELKTPRNSSVWDNSTKTIFISDMTIKEKVELDNIFIEKIDFTKNIALQICDAIFKHELLSIIIEGGATTIQTFIDEGLWDEARVFTGDQNFTEGTKAPILSREMISEQKIMSDTLKTYKKL